MGKKILVVDDSGGSRLLVVAVLRMAEHDVIQAGDAVEAMMMLAEENVDLVVTDLYMPMASGIDLTHWIRSDLGLNHVPVIMISGEASGGKRHEALAAGVDRWVDKPVHAGELIIAVEELTGVHSKHAGAAEAKEALEGDDTAIAV